MSELREGDCRAHPNILGAIEIWTDGKWVLIEPMADVARLRAENEKLRAELAQAYEQCAKIAEGQRKRLDYELSYTGKEDDLKQVYPAEGHLIAAAIRAAAAIRETGDD